ncbi:MULTISPECIES: LysR family transcriptional regulator [Rhizobium]|uniref:HTH-type transcriptional regulator TtuA n=1 Tax=Rhizobium tropici TaxID=398 RepID=A0A6P1C552_RHITR|nr:MULTISPECIES: LysR family transcriptional regulator [Rhizobium]AGB73112.1 transcriptional regulator, LysR family [Rhizobium tropici CIAT 899]NEV11362.1 LysR family transcriptional regulator [Rhizobium tropici]TGE93159.1 LysR family transcriptional regulator [Rhizobium sp. SEMIA 4088]
MTEQIGIDRLTGIIAFARAASLGSYTAAARSLSISPSAISKSVQRLEERLGVRLFSRTTRSLTLTPEGLVLHERALRLLQQAEEIEQAAAATRAEPAGLLKITTALPVGVHLISPHLPAFRALYPKVSIDLRLGDTFTDLVEEGIDVAIRVGQPVDSRLISRKLAPNRVCAFASPAYLERRGMPTRPEDLDSHDCVNLRYQSSGQSMRWPFRTGDRIQEILPNAGIVVDNSDAVMAVLLNGGGIGISATYIAGPYVARGELVPVLKNYWMDRHHITALWPESRRGNPNVKAFVAFFAELFSEPTPWDSEFTLA